MRLARFYDGFQSKGMWSPETLPGRKANCASMVLQKASGRVPPKR
jgi:hypothetical protein